MRFPRIVAFVVCLPLVAGLAIFGQQTVSVDKLTEFVKSAIKQKNPDQDVAKFLSTMKMGEKVTPAVVEDLQMAGAGPKTVEALRQLVTKTATLSSPTKTVITKPVSTGPPEPSASAKKEVLAEAREFALNYVKSLPDFICLQATRRSVDNHFEIGSEGSWSFQDRLAEKLTFFDHKENYELLQYNENSTVGKTWESVGGSMSRGEWASLMANVFEPSTHTDFQWLRWGNLDSSLMHVFQYRVDREYSQETISYQNDQKITAGFHGLVYVQNGVNVVRRITVVPDIPPSFPIQDIDQQIDYNYQPIGEQTHLLPTYSRVVMRVGHQASMNEIDWRQYRKYSADSTIRFDTADDKSDGGEKEQPAAGAAGTPK